MDLSALAGNAALKQQLTQQAEGRGLSHAYIISGPPGSGKHTLAEILAQALLCSGPAIPCGQCANCRKAVAGIHPDLSKLGEDGKEITVAQIRALRADAYIRPNEAQRKVYWIDRAHTMNPSAQTTMLKLLEEGPPYAAFLLLAENAATLLPTVRSRCEVLSLTPTDSDPDQGAEQDNHIALAAGILERLASDSESALAACLIPLEKWDRDEFSILMDTFIQLLRDTLVCQAGGSCQASPAVRQAAQALPTAVLFSAIETAEQLRGACGFHVGTGHLCGWLCAALSDVKAGSQP